MFSMWFLYLRITEADDVQPSSGPDQRDRRRQCLGKTSKVGEYRTTRDYELALVEEHHLSQNNFISESELIPT